MKLQSIVLCAFWMMFGCFHSNPVKSGEDAVPAGMVLVPSKNQTALLGSNAPKALLDEQPVTEAEFTYDYFMDTVEVTAGAYRQIIGKLPNEYDTIGMIGEQLPVIYVSWYDAVLFCNARSKLVNRDTVYSFISIERTATGEVYRLAGLTTNFAANGFRLPTEAEWNFAARKSTSSEFIWGEEESLDSAAKYAWFAGNALSKPHDVAGRAPTSLGIYDLCGNVSEWVNETKVPLNGIKINDFAGGTGFTATLKILKGGCYRHEIRSLRIPLRSEEYPVDAASRNRYTGFRCVAGAIKKPSFIGNGTSSVIFEPVTLVSSGALRFGGNARLVFTNKSGDETRTLCFVDYAVNPPAVYQFTDRIKVFTPTISPDGAWVAWASSDEGMSDNSSVLVRKLKYDDTLVVTLPDTPAYVPRWFVEPATKDTFVVYVTSARPNDQSSWTSSKTKMVQFKDGHFAGSPQVVVEQGAFHGGRSHDGTYIATGSPLLKMKNTTTGETKTLFYPPFDGKTGTEPSQVCNVSISPDPFLTSQVLFLDFGSGRDVSTLTKTVYDVHQYMFIADFSGNALSWYRVPQPYYSWNHCEWSTKHAFAVAAARTANGAQRSIYGVNLQTSAMFPLCEGTQLEHPFLWIDPDSKAITTDLALDSVGQYDAPHLSNQQALLAYKMRRFWEWIDSMEVIFIGSSVAADGIDPRLFTTLFGYNMATGGGDLGTNCELLKNYVLPHGKKLKIIALSYDPHLMFLESTATEQYMTFTKSKGYLYDKRHGFWQDGVPESFRELVQAVTIPTTGPPVEVIDSFGLVQFPCDGFGPDTPPVIARVDDNTNGSVYKKNMAALVEIFRLCKLQGIKVVVVNFPVHPGYRTIDAYGPFGISHANAAKMVADMQHEDSLDDNLLFYDAHQDGLHDYSKFEFVDHLHLCEAGAQKLSARVDSIFQQVLRE